MNGQIITWNISELGGVNSANIHGGILPKQNLLQRRK